MPTLALTGITWRPTTKELTPWHSSLQIVRLLGTCQQVPTWDLTSGVFPGLLFYALCFMIKSYILPTYTFGSDVWYISALRRIPKIACAWGHILLAKVWLNIALLAWECLESAAGGRRYCLGFPTEFATPVIRSQTFRMKWMDKYEEIWFLTCKV